MRIGVLTSSRADYGIYLPLLKLLHADNRFQVEIIAFGMHLFDKYGKSLNEILKDNLGKIHVIEGMPTSDRKKDIALGYGNLVKNFAHFFYENHYNIVLALGDRFEMSAAVQAGIPFEIKFAHLFGGETTLGATDEIYRHQITLASKLHFVATNIFAKRVANIINSTDNIFVVGALSLDNIPRLKPWPEVCKLYNIPNRPFILITVHPETVQAENNIKYADQLFEALLDLSTEDHLLITGTNADVNSTVYEKRFEELKKLRSNNVTIVKNLGRENYFAAMKNSLLLLGNTSSGIIEAASFGKYVVNLGNRQHGRPQNENIINVPFEKDAIKEAVKMGKRKGAFTGKNIYHKPNSAKLVVNALYNARL